MRDTMPTTAETAPDAARTRFRPAVPRPRRTPMGLVEFLRAARANPLTTWMEDHFTLPLVAADGVLGRVTVVSEPGLIRHLLVENAGAYRKDDLQRRVLVRVLRADLSDDEAAVERFRGDVRAAALSGTPDRPRVLDAGNDPETRAPFVVLEWRQEPPADAARSAAAMEATAQIPTFAEAPRAAPPRLAKISPRGRAQGRGIRAAEVLVIGMLLVVPLGLGALAIGNCYLEKSMQTADRRNYKDQFELD